MHGGLKQATGEQGPDPNGGGEPGIALGGTSH